MKGCAVQQQGLDSMVLVGPTQLKTCCDSVKGEQSNGVKRVKKKKKKRKTCLFP